MEAERVAILAAESHSTHDRISHPSAVRFPRSLQRELEALAERDANSFSATVRRLVMAGLRSEQSQRRSGAEDGD
jgi:hypothetical protein